MAYNYGFGGPMMRMGEIEREEPPYYEEEVSDSDYEEDEDKSEFEKYRQPSRLNLEDLEKNNIYYITFSDAGAEDKYGYFVDIDKPVRNIRAKLIQIQEPEQIKYNVPISESLSKWKLIPRDNEKLKDVLAFVDNSKLSVYDAPIPKSALIGKLGKSILRQKKDFIIPGEVEKIIEKYSRKDYDKEHEDYVKQKKKELDERMAKLLGRKMGGKKHKKTKSHGRARTHVRKTKRHYKKTRKHMRK
jgi:hypothetical protein